MPVALRIAFAVSLGLHAVLLLAPRIGPAPVPENPPPLVAELRPALPEPPAPPPRMETRKPEKTAVPVKPRPPRKPKAATPPDGAARPLLAAQAPGPVPVPTGGNPSASDATPSNGATLSEPVAPVVPAVSPERLPPRGRIRFQVDWGDAGFEIGVARQEWAFEAGRYRLTSSVETTGLAWLLRSVDIEMESLGRLSDAGLQPEAFGILRSGRKARERALFDWEAMKIRVSADHDHALDPGAQDLLSFYYQLGFLDIAPGQTKTLPLATGKKYSIYRLENLGDETLESPLGILATRHLRTPGENATEIWLSYDYRLLPVKIRHDDNDGSAFVQVATEILFGHPRP
jgi:hypothetical protein